MVVAAGGTICLYRKLFLSMWPNLCFDIQWLGVSCHLQLALGCGLWHLQWAPMENVRTIVPYICEVQSPYIEYALKAVYGGMALH